MTNVTLTTEQAQQIEEALKDIVRVFKFETGTPVEALAVIRAARAQEQAEQDLDTCPGCGGVADNGHDREFPPNPYYCTKCSEQAEQEPVALSKTEQDAKRYAYMMHPDFFEVCDVDSRVYRYKVGLQSSVEKGFPKPINQCIEGYGETLEAAIDMAIAAQQPVSEPVARVIVRPFNPMDASCPTTEVKWLKEPVPGFLYAAPVRTKDLTDAEIADIGTNCGTSMWSLMFARAVIAKFKEKNK